MRVNLLYTTVSEPSHPRVFVSYSWDDKDHQTWVEELAARLTREGLDVTLDRWDAQPGDDLPFFMERSVRDSRFVVLICTPIYKTRFDERHGGVGYEAKVIVAEILLGLGNRKVIPVHRSGSWKEAAPSIVLGDIYVNLTGSPYKETAYKQLVDILHGRREIERPVGQLDGLFEGPSAAPALPVPSFLGRDEELRSLLAYLSAPDEQAVCVVVSGIGGVGKTALVRQLVATQAVRLFPEGAAWLDGSDLPFHLARAARRFGWSEETDPTPEQATRFLASQLHGRAALLVVDNFPVGANSAHIPIPGGKCRTLITTNAVGLLRDLDVPVETIRLGHWPLETCREYLRALVPRLVRESDADLDGLSRFVQGLPLAIRLIARALAGDRDQSAKDHLAKLEAEPLQTLDESVAGADRGVAATFLDAHRALSVGDQAVLRALGVCARETSKKFVAAVAGMNGSAAAAALNSLADVSLAEYRDGAKGPWGLHDVVRMFVRALPGSHDAQGAHLKMIYDHLQRHAHPTAHEALDDGIEEAIVAFEVLLSRAEHDEADMLLISIYPHLIRRGRYVVALDLAERLLARLPLGHPSMARWLGNLGICQYRLDDVLRALDCHQRALVLNHSLGQLFGEADNLGNLGNCYSRLGEISKAIDFHQRALTIDVKLENLEGQSVHFGNLGNCYSRLGEISKAIDFHQRALTIDAKLENLEGQARHLGNVGNCYSTLGEISKAIDLFQRALALAKRVGTLDDHIGALVGLGNCYLSEGSQKDVQKGGDYYQEAITLSEKSGRSEGRASVLVNLGNSYAERGISRRRWTSFNVPWH